MSGSDGISKVCIQLLLKEPFYGHYLMGVPKSFQSDIPTAAVRLYKRQLVQLTVNESFWNSLSPAHQYGLLKHEVLHITLQHLFISKDFTNHRLFNIAADIVVNQYIALDQLPEGGILLEHFIPLEPLIGFRLEKGKGVHYYYDALHKLLHSSDAPDSRQESSQDPEMSEALQRFKSILTDDHQELSRHDYWQEVGELSHAEINVMVQQYKGVLRSALQRTKLKKQGHLPAHLLEQFEVLLREEPKVNWRRVLRMFAATSTSSFLKNTIRRPSKRFGVVPGIKIKRRQRLLVAVDTSGSVHIEELESFFNEIYHIYRSGAEVRVVECDAAIHKVYSFRGTFPEGVHGRGGTSFEPVIELANKELPDGLVYLTDGGAPQPKIPSRIPVLWVITPNGAGDHLKGRVVKMATL